MKRFHSIPPSGLKIYIFQSKNNSFQKKKRRVPRENFVSKKWKPRIQFFNFINKYIYKKKKAYNHTASFYAVTLYLLNIYIYIEFFIRQNKKERKKSFQDQNFGSNLFPDEKKIGKSYLQENGFLYIYI